MSRTVLRIHRHNWPKPSRMVWGAGSVLTLLLLWQLVTGWADLIGPNVLPSPSSVARTLWTLQVDGFSGAKLEGHVLASLSRWGLGVAIAVGVGVPLGALLAWVPVVRALMMPVFEIVRFIPPFAWIPIAVLWFGAGLTAQATVVFIAAFPPCVINSHLGVARADPILLRAATNLGAGEWRTLFSVVRPVATPSIIAGIRIAFGNGWMAIIGAELVVGTKGLGFLISQGQANGNTRVIIAGMVAIGVVGFLVDALIQKLFVRSQQWHTRTSGGR